MLVAASCADPLTFFGSCRKLPGMFLLAVTMLVIPAIKKGTLKIARLGTGPLPGEAKLTVTHERGMALLRNRLYTCAMKEAAVWEMYVICESIKNVTLRCVRTVVWCSDF